LSVLSKTFRHEVYDGQEKINNTNDTIHYVEICDCEFDEMIVPILSP